MSEQEKNLQEKVKEAIANPKNVGEMTDADAIGTVGNSECGEMLRMWIKYKKDEASGKEVIDKATFQSFGCETAIAVASLATEMIQGKSRDEVLALKGEELSKDLGPLPPMKIHCAELVEGALRSALGNKETVDSSERGKSETLLGKMNTAKAGQSRKIVFLDDDESALS